MCSALHPLLTAQPSVQITSSIQFGTCTVFYTPTCSSPCPNYFQPPCPKNVQYTAQASVQYSTVHYHTQPSPLSNLPPVYSMKDCTVQYTITHSPANHPTYYHSPVWKIVQYSTLHTAQPTVQLTTILQYGRLYSTVHCYT